MKIPFVYHPIYSVPFPTKHRFRMPKFYYLYERLLQQGIISPKNIIRPKPIDLSTIEIAHDPNYVNLFFKNQLEEKAMKRIGLPWSVQLGERIKHSIAGTILTAQLAVENGIACHLAGGTHHAHFDFGSGFCIFNDLAIAALTLIQRQLADVIFILDCDVHQGDGTATILENTSNVFTCSIHCKNNFPLRKPESDLDIALEKDIGDKEYMEALEQALKTMLEFEPDLVLYDAGVDVHKEDALGKLNISSEGIAQRDHKVLSTCIENYIPVATVVGGGYHDDIHHLAKRHSIVHEQAIKFC